jgi:glycosyltransferase involved in cell wall biosynthesis
MPISVPFLSVVVPVFNEDPLLMIEALRSIQRQSFSDFECIVVDDSSSHNATDVCRSFCMNDSRFKYIHSGVRLGLPASLNAGLKLSRGRYIARFDADDINLLSRFEKQIMFLNQNTEIDVVGSNIEIIDEIGGTIAFRNYPESHSGITRGMHFTMTLANPTTMFRRELYDRLGGYNLSFKFSEDLELWLRWMNGGAKFANIQEYLVRYRKQDARRNSLHWRFNLRARILNFRWSHLLLRVLGIFIITIWIATPSRLRGVIFNVSLLQKTKVTAR